MDTFNRVSRYVFFWAQLRDVSGHLAELLVDAVAVVLGDTDAHRQVSQVGGEPDVDQAVSRLAGFAHQPAGAQGAGW